MVSAKRFTQKDRRRDVRACCWIALAWGAMGCSANRSSASNVPPPAHSNDLTPAPGASIGTMSDAAPGDAASGSSVVGPEVSATRSPSSDAGSISECEWIDMAQPAMKPFRATAKKLLDEHAPGEKPTAITCCALGEVDALCRAKSHKTPSPRDYRYAVYTRLVGVSATKSEPWFDAPVEVADYKTMKQVNPPWDLELTLTVQGATFSLQENGGKCPRKCSASQGGCKKWEVQAERACKAVGHYERSNGTLNRR